MLKLKIIFLTILITLIETLSLFYLKKSISNNLFLIIPIIGYITIVFLLFNILKDNDLIIVNDLWQIFNIFFVTTLGIIILKEKINNKQIVAIILSIIASVILIFS